MTDTLSPLVDDWPLPLFKLDEKQTIVWTNQASQEWLGKSLRQLTGKSIWDLIQTDLETRATIQKSGDNSVAITSRDIVVKVSGQTDEEGLLAHLTAYPTQGGTGLSIWFVGRKPRSSKMGGHIVTGMGRMIAHELKNPLAGIKGAAQLLRDDVESAEGLALIELISSEIDRIRRLADRMEKLGDDDPASTQRVNIHEVLRQSRRVLQSANPNVVFAERYDPSIPHASGDPDTLMQAVLNLIKNAIESAGEHGQVRLETSHRVGVRGGKSSRHLPIQIRIIDNGPGISKEMLPQIFQPFVTTKPEGQGLGLALVSKVAAAHEGLVEVESVPGRTVFTLLLPAPIEAT